MPQIKVHEKALAHLSRGLYRSPASALRELVSNAWDANATEVRLTTNYPLFLQLAIEDNGNGFTRDEFENIMGGGIGNSQKRPIESPLLYGRPTIGRLGIGMLGIAQICGAFTLISKPRQGQGFRARVRLYDLLKERLDRDDELLVREEEVDVGEYTIEAFDPEQSRYGTVLIADDLHPTFVRSFQSSLKYERFKEPSFDWKKCLRVVSSVHSLQELGDYWRLLWELAASCPVPYVASNALPKRLAAEEQRILESYNFKVIVDGIQLYKPVNLRGNDGGYTAHKIEDQHQRIYSRDLRFHGYVVVQEGAQLRPDELRGIMIRVKNVGIGYYDPSLLDYRFNEGPRSRWVTGEIFVDEGLENALNIDRDSFNRFHPEFKAIQEYVHKLLRSSVFPQSYKQINVRSTAKAVAKSEARKSHFRDVVTKTIATPVSIKENPRKAVVDLSSAIAVKKNNAVEIAMPRPETIETKKSHQLLASSILAIYDLAGLETSASRKREVFRDLLVKLLAGW
jgi:hypothetical protein